MSGERTDSDADSQIPGVDPVGVDAIWEWNRGTGELVWSRGLEATFGLDEPDVDSEADWWHPRIHPADRERVEADFAASLATDSTWAAEFRVRGGDGEYTEVSLTAAIIREGDEAVRLIGTAIDVGVMRDTLGGLQELTDRYRVLVDQNLVGIGLIQDGEFVYVNPRMAEIHGRDRTALLGVDPAELVPEATRETADAAIRRLVDGETDEATFTGEIARGDDDPVYIDAHLKRTTYREAPAILVVTVDITEQVAAERARETSHRLFRATFEKSLDGFVIAADDGTVVDVNPAACEMFGIDRGSIVGRPVEEVDAVTLESEGPEGLFRDRGADRGRFTLVRPEGERRTVEFAVTADILPDRHLFVLRDVTERRRQEDALQQERERLDFMNAMLRHHLLNGMNVVLAVTDRLAEDAEGAQRDRLETIRGRGTRMVELIETMRSLIRTIRGYDGAGFESIDLGSALRTAVDSTESAHPGATVSLVVPSTDLSVHADELLVEVFEALLDNAVRHQEQVEPVVDVRVEADETTVSVHVADEGPGIPRTVREDVFEGNTTVGTTGFDLTVVQLLVTLYDGDLRFEDREPRGSVVTVTLPRATTDGP